MDERKLENILDELGIPLNLLGCKYWITATKLKLEDANIQIGQVYRIVAKRHETTPTRAERALRHSFENKKDFIRKYFGVNCNINNSMLLALLAREMRRTKC